MDKRNRADESIRLNELKNRKIENQIKIITLTPKMIR
jgi:hypothetical protein